MTTTEEWLKLEIFFILVPLVWLIGRDLAIMVWNEVQ